jgi:hypothetical protein
LDYLRWKSGIKGRYKLESQLAFGNWLLAKKSYLQQAFGSLPD